MARRGDWLRGAGKTTLANELGRRLCLPVLHVDGFYWQQRPDGGRVESTPEEWIRIHDGLIGGERWVIDGMKLGVLQARLEAADTVVLLDLAAWRCLWGVVKRRLRYRGQLRPDIGVYDRINAEFVRWIWSFRRTARPRVKAGRKLTPLRRSKTDPPGGVAVSAAEASPEGEP